MPKISLRAYNREISNLIDRGQTDEAIAHCQYILQAYPKHLETYRLLGKAYLEAHKHTEAVDIFQRVLAVVPDDFITHVGMSIIRGEENNLDGAIWHMERAFEVQLSNQAIQDELKELYGKRDGQKPAKIRITRGGLCRMYARGNQYRQAVAEIKSALQETPDRADLEVILAKMYYQSGMTSDALDLCRKLLEKMPFCYEANKLMVQILKDANKAKEADFYQKKLNALDPYEEFLTDPSASLDTIVDDTVMVEKFFYDPSEKTVQAKTRTQTTENEEPAPDWLVSDLSGAQDIGEKGFTRILDSTVLPNEPEPAEPAMGTQPVVTEPKQEEELPNWLKEEGGVTPASDASIPDFLKATGWAEAGTISEDAPPAQVINVDEPVQSGEITPGEIPDWLKSAAPEGVTEILNPEDLPQSPDASFQDWLSTLNEEAPTEESADASSEASAEVPVVESTEPKAPVEPTLEENETLPIQAVTSDLPTEEAQPAEQLPDWLSEISTEVSPVAEGADTTPDWLKEETVSGEMADIPTLPSEGEKVTAVFPATGGTTILSPDDAIPADTFPIAGGTSILSPEDIPDWLQDLTPSAEGKEAAPQAFATEESAPSVPVVTPPSGSPQEVVTMNLTPEEQSDMPDWLAEIQQATNVQPEPIPEPVAEPVDERKTKSLPEDEKEDLDRQPDWLHLLDQEENVNREAPASQPVNVADFAASSEAPAEFTVEEPVGEEEKPTTSILPPNPEDQEKELPDWLKELDSGSSAEGTMPAESVPESEQAEYPDWLKGYPSGPAETALPPAEPAEEAVATDAQDVPDWLKELDVTGDTKGSVPEMPDWLKGSVPGVAEATQPVVRGTVPDMPSWMAPSEPVAEAPSEPVAETPAEAVEPPAAEKSIEDLVSDLVDEVAPPPVTLPETTMLEMTEEPAPTEEAEISPIESPQSETPVEEEVPLLEEVPAAEESIEESPAVAEEPVAMESQEIPADEAAPVSEEPVPAEREPVAEETYITTETIDFSQQSSTMEEVSEEVPMMQEAEIEVQTEQVSEEAPVSEVTPELEMQPEPELTTTEPAAEEIAETPVEEVAEETPVDVPESVVEPEHEAEPLPEPVMQVPEIPQMEFSSAGKVAVPTYSEADFADLFNNAVAAIHSGDMSAVADQFTPLIKAEHRLDEVIETLSKTAEEQPNDFTVWSLLGDAYGRTGKLQKALDAYTRAEDNLQ